MQEARLYDFDDMVLRVVHAMEVFPDLRFNLQEKYLYILVDEFQDTNLAQSRTRYQPCAESYFAQSYQHAHWRLTKHYGCR